jgi:hypothetical protein
LTRIGKTFQRLVVSYAVPAGSRKVTVAFNFISGRTVLTDFVHSIIHRENDRGGSDTSATLVLQFCVITDIRKICYFVQVIFLNNKYNMAIVQNLQLLFPFFAAITDRLELDNWYFVRI